MKPFDGLDELGPEKIVHLHNYATGLQAIVVVDNTACGPAVGGCRMAIDVTLEECARLARAMTLKNVSAGLPHGGAKSVILADPQMPDDEKQELMRSFAQAIDTISEYIVGPDMGTNERYMSYVHDEIHRAVGLPRAIGGIPLDEIGATGLGVCSAALAAEPWSGVKVDGATFVVQGFGAVGLHAARYLSQRGAKLVGACDSSVTITNPDGIDVDALATHKRRTGSLAEFGSTEQLDRDEVIGLSCDIWIPAARPDIISMENVDQLDTKLIVQGANIPITVEAEEWLHEKGVISIPDYIANAGGVICAAVEYRGGGESEAVTVIDEKITRNTQDVLALSAETKHTPRRAADTRAIEQLKIAMHTRRWH